MLKRLPQFCHVSAPVAQRAPDPRKLLDLFTPAKGRRGHVSNPQGDGGEDGWAHVAGGGVGHCTQHVSSSPILHKPHHKLPVEPNGHRDHRHRPIRRQKQGKEFGHISNSRRAIAEEVFQAKGVRKRDGEPQTGSDTVTRSRRTHERMGQQELHDTQEGALSVWDSKNEPCDPWVTSFADMAELRAWGAGGIADSISGSDADGRAPRRRNGNSMVFHVLPPGRTTLGPTRPVPPHRPRGHPPPAPQVQSAPCPNGGIRRSPPISPTSGRRGICKAQNYKKSESRRSKGGGGIPNAA